MNARVKNTSTRRRARRSKKLTVAALSAMIIAPYAVGGLTASLESSSPVKTIVPQYFNTGDTDNLAILTALIVRHTTTATKTEGCGVVSLHARSSTVATGERPCNHMIRWRLTSYPDGFTMTCADPRRGAKNGSTINARDGDWYGWSYPVPCSHAGSYTAEMTITAPDGTSSTDTESWTIAAQSSFTDVYVDSNASGSDDGSSADDAYPTIVSALADANTEGSEVNIYVAKGHTETPASSTTVTCDNLRITTYGTGDDPLYDLQTATTLWRFAGENILVENQQQTDTVNTNAAGAFVQTQVAVDIEIKNCGIDSGSNIFRSFVDNSTTVSVGVNHIRWFFWDCNSEVGCQRYSGVFGTYQELNILGGRFGPTDVERVCRWNENWGGGECHATAVGLYTTTDHKDCWRLHEGDYFYFHRCHGVSTGDASTVSVFGENGGTPEHITFSECDILVNASTGVFCIRSDMAPDDNDEGGIPDGGEDVCIRGCIIETTETSSAAQSLQFNDGVIQRVFLIGNTFISPNAGVQNCFIISNPQVSNASEYRNNIFKYTGAATANRLVYGTNMAVYENNDLDVGNCTDTTPYRLNSSNQNIAAVNSSGLGTSNADKAHTLDANFLPSSPSSATITDSQFFDYYGTENTIGDTSGYRGAVNAVPTTPTLEGSVPADNATGVGTTVNITFEFSENMKTGDGTISIYETSGDVLHDTAIADDLTVNISDKTEVSWTTLNTLTSDTAYYVQASSGVLQSLMGADWGGIDDKTTLNFTTTGGAVPTTSRSRDRSRVR